MSAVITEGRLMAVERESTENRVRLNEHERQCAERYQEIRRYMHRITGILLWVGGMLMAGMAGILVKLVFWPAGG